MVKHRENILSDCDDGYCRIYESKIVSEEELIPYLNSGWDVIKELRNGKIVIRKQVR